jgi:hypothetical protein
VRYIVSSEELDLPRLYEAEPAIYRNDGALPEAYVVNEARVVEEDAARLGTLLDPGFEPRVEVVLEAAPLGFAAQVEDSEKDMQGEAVVWREGADRVRVMVKVAEAGYLVLGDTYYPGWRATVDGEPVEILRANHAFRAVALEAGEHTVLFEYVPLSFRVGAWITLGAGLLLAATLALVWLRRGTG